MPLSRLKFQKIFESLLGSDHVYFQPPENVVMKYPCIIYKLADVDIWYASNKPYKITRLYEITLIHYDPDNSAIDRLLSLPTCSFERYYPYDNLHHYVFNVYMENIEYSHES